MRASDSHLKVLSIVLLVCAGCSSRERTSAVSNTEAQTAASTKRSDSPATLAEAAQVIDVDKLPLYPGATFAGQRRPAAVFYEAPATVRAAFDFHAKQLLERNWHQEDGAQISDQYASATFLRDGFALVLSVFPAGNAGKCNVSFTCLGNLDLTTLPVPPDAKSFYAGTTSVMYLSEVPPKKVADACRKLLVEKGWEPHGLAGDTEFFRKNAIRLTATIDTAPAQGNKTMITYSTVLMSAELPAAPFAQDLQYADTTATLSFETTVKPAEVYAFYRQALAKSKWEPTTTTPIQDGRKAFQIFRNPTKDMLTLETSSKSDSNECKVSLKFQDAAEVAELERHFKQRQAENARKKGEAGK